MIYLNYMAVLLGAAFWKGGCAAAVVRKFLWKGMIIWKKTDRKGSSSAPSASSPSAAVSAGFPMPMAGPRRSGSCSNFSLPTGSRTCRLSRSPKRSGMMRRRATILPMRSKIWSTARGPSCGSFARSRPRITSFSPAIPTCGTGIFPVRWISRILNGTA